MWDGVRRSSRYYEFGPFAFDPSQQDLRFGDEVVTLPNAMNRLLLLFVSRPGDLISRDEIASTLWDEHGTIDIESGINNAVRRLRSQLAQAGGDVVYIATVVGTGYRFAVPVTLVVPTAPPGATPKTEATATAAAEEQPETSPSSSQPSPSQPAALRSSPSSAQAGEGTPVSSALPAGRPSPRIFRARNIFAAAALSVLLLAALGGRWLHDAAHAPTKTDAHAGEAPFFRNTRPLTFDEPEDNLTAQAISPSRESLAYADHAGITVRALTTGVNHLLNAPPGLHVDRIAWHPQERIILVSGAIAGSVPQQDQVWIVSLSGDQPRLLFDNAELATFSPDGQRVVFTRGQQTQLWVADANGQNARRLQPEDSGEAFLWVLWSPDGKRIVTDRSRDIQPSAEEAKAAKNNPVDQLQIEHKWIYQSYDAEGGKLLASAPGLHFDSAVLLRSGELIFPTNTRDSGLSLSRVRTDPGTGAILDTPTILQPGASIWGANGYAAASLSASADGHHFSAILDRHATDVYVADLHWSENTPSLDHVTRLTHHTSTSYPTNWTPSGDALLFDNGYAGTSVVARQRVGSDKLEVVIDTKTSAVGHYTPDGKWILFLQYVGDPARLQAIGRIPAQGGTPQMLSVPGDLESFNCSNSSSGSCVLREREGKSQLVFYDLDPLHGRGAELARIPWKPTVFGDWKLSPDGRTVAMADHDPVHPGIELLSLRAAGHTAATHDIAEIPLPGFGSVLEPVWATDGRSFFIETHTAEGFDLVYRDAAGHATLLRQSPDSIWPVLSRDGKKIAFPGRTPLNRNVWIGTR